MALLSVLPADDISSYTKNPENQEHQPPPEDEILILSADPVVTVGKY